MANMPKAAAKFRFFVSFTIITLYALILAGGIVRSTGSGLGCPDWPRCFGRWVPPTELSELPADYKTRYAEDGLPPELVVFNPVLTWVEYANRLLGALVGLFVVVSTFLAFRAFGFSLVSGLSLLATLLTGVQGWLGSKVVSSALMPWIITTHNALAQIIVYALIAAYMLSQRTSQLAQPSRQERNLALLLWLFAIGQFYLGLGVRQWTDTLQQAGAGKEAIMADFLRGGHTSLFLLHRSFSWVLAGVLFWQLWRYARVRKDAYDEGISYYQAAGACVICNIIIGVVMQFVPLTAYAQPLHLLFGSALLGILFAIYLLSVVAPRPAKA